MDDERSEAAWRALVSAALMGTERAPFTSLTAAGELGAALAALDPANPERALLDSAAVLATYRRAGALPPRAGVATPSACAPETLPVPSERAANALALVLRKPSPYLEVREWCSLATQAGVRLPDQYLPAILDLLSRGPASYAPLIDSIGPRGRWLAAHNPAWRLLALEPGGEADAWATGDRPTRLFALQRARHRDPAQGRALLESTWKTESADDRARFLRELDRGLSMADEPLLEKALDDRAKGVRSVAAMLLIRLGESRLVARMIERVKPLISFERRTGRLQATLPEACDAGMQRDGVDPKPLSADTGEKTWWFVQMLRCVPPAVWVEAFDARPEALIAAAERSIWKPPLLDGWTEAAIYHADAQWLNCLPVRCFWGAPHSELAVEYLPAGLLESLITRLLQADQPLNTDHPIFGILQFEFPVFTPVQTRHALARMRQTSEKEMPNPTSGLLPDGVRMAVGLLLAALAPTAISEAEAAIGVQDGDYSRWGAPVREAMQRLYVRREIYSAFGKL